MYSVCMFKYTLIIIAFLLTLAYQGCTGTSSPNELASATSDTCVAPAGVSGSPKTIEDVVALINALPKPVTVPCFLASLNRPLKVSLTSNPFSAQPAVGERSPRIFIMIGNLFISVVPEGDGAKLIEFSSLLTVDTSIKAELSFPVTARLTPEAPYERIRFQGGTACAPCHANETRVSSITFANAFSSRALQPRPDFKVDLDYLRVETRGCDSAIEPERCAILKALFNYGPVQSQDFPAGMPYAFSF